MEEYLQPKVRSVLTPPPNDGSDSDDNADASETTVGDTSKYTPRWVDLSKRLFLCYFDRYLVYILGESGV